MMQEWIFGVEKILKCHFVFGCVEVKKHSFESSIITHSFSGTLVTAPCSHVGHIFRKRSPYKWLPGVNVVKKNAVRVAEVWLDEYKVQTKRS
jgi:hypothetical protein